MGENPRYLEKRISAPRNGGLGEEGVLLLPVDREVNEMDLRQA